MNRSGAALASLRADPAFNPATDLLVLVDDFQIPCGTFRLRSDGSSGGHNGLKSIEGALQSQAYARLRIGVGPLPEGAGDWSDYVLAPFTPEQVEQVEALLPQMVEAVTQWVQEGAPQVLRLGIVGLPNVGKSTLFNALTSSKAAAAENYPFCTVEPNVGVVEVPDRRLD